VYIHVNIYVHTRTHTHTHTQTHTHTDPKTLRHKSHILRLPQNSEPVLSRWKSVSGLVSHKHPIFHDLSLSHTLTHKRPMFHISLSLSHTPTITHTHTPQNSAPQITYSDCLNFTLAFAGRRGVRVYICHVGTNISIHVYTLTHNHTHSHFLLHKHTHTHTHTHKHTPQNSAPQIAYSDCPNFPNSPFCTECAAACRHSPTSVL